MTSGEQNITVIKDNYNVEEVEYLLDEGHKDPFIEELSRYRESGRPVDAIDAAGYTWLTRAIISHNVAPYPNCVEERIRAVIAAGGNPNAPNDETYPLVYACGWQFGYGLGPNSGLVKLLLDVGANPSQHLDIDIPSTIVDEDGNIDFSNDTTTHIDSLEMWLSDVERQNEIIEAHSNSLHAACITTRREITAIRSLLAMY